MFNKNNNVEEFFLLKIMCDTTCTSNVSHMIISQNKFVVLKVGNNRCSEQLIIKISLNMVRNGVALMIEMKSSFQN